jgi:hypothetical protein
MAKGSFMELTDLKKIFSDLTVGFINNESQHEATISNILAGLGDKAYAVYDSKTNEYIGDYAIESWEIENIDNKIDVRLKFKTELKSVQITMKVPS